MEKNTPFAPVAYTALRDLQRQASGISFDDLLERYAVWLPEGGGLSDVSSASYLSHIRSLERGALLGYQQLHPEQADYLVRIISALRAGNREEAERIVKELTAFLKELQQRVKEKPQASVYAASTLSDWGSGWKKFSAFLLQEWDAPEEEPADTPTLAEAVANFRDWLVRDQGFGTASASTYRSRLLNIQKNLFDPNGFVGAIITVQALALTASEDASRLMGDLLSFAEWKVSTGARPSGWTESVCQASLSVTKKYQEFICAIAEEDHPQASEQEALARLGQDAHEAQTQAEAFEQKYREVVSEYTHKALFRIFVSRLRTQDRLEKFHVFDITKLFHQQRGLTPLLYHYIHFWYERCLGGMLVHTEDETYPFDEVESLRLVSGGRVVVSIKSIGERTLYTRTRDGRFVPMQATDIKEISIEHMPAIVNFLETNRLDLMLLPLSEKKTQQLAEILSGDDERRRSRLWLDLIHDLDFIAENVQLELMQRSENVNQGK